MKNATIFSLFTGVILTSFTTLNLNNGADFLLGTWQIDGKNQFEVWELKGENHLEGSGYSLKKGEKTTTETLEIKMIDGVLTYSATVANQNNGETIYFPLNANINDRLSFENPNHDFPKKIQYQQIQAGKLHVWVLGKGDKGFDFEMVLQ